MKKNLKKVSKKKTTELFKEEFIFRTIIPKLNWKGSKMIFPYSWNGHIVYAVVSFPNIKWDVKTP
jgi:hypothetical protein